MNTPPKTVSESTLRDSLSKGREILAETRALITEAFQKDFDSQRKADQTWVTEIDFAVERHLRKRLGEQFPGYGIVGEEFPDQNRIADLTWVIDPIDGTSSLRHRVPLFGTILALRQEDKSVLGLIDLPMLGRLYSGGAGLGVWCNERQVRIDDVDNDSEIPDQIISLFPRVPKMFDDVMRLHPNVRTYGDCFGHGLVIEGAVGAMVDFDLRIWDVAATEILVPAAGGKFVCVRQRPGKDNSPIEVRYDVIFGKPRVVDWILRTAHL